MESLNKSHHADLESGGGGGGGGGDGHHRSSAAARDTSEGQEGEIGHSLGDEIVGVLEKRKESGVAQRTVVVDLETGGEESSKVHLVKIERDCRICQLSLDTTNQESGVPIELGCSCKDDLAAAHRHCAEAWFKIKGNKVCEICGSVARNVPGAIEAELSEQRNESNDAAASAPAPQAEARNFWQGHRFLNFLLACMVFAFVISWLFHFNVPS